MGCWCKFKKDHILAINFTFMNTQIDLWIERLCCAILFEPGSRLMVA